MKKTLLLVFLIIIGIFISRFVISAPKNYWKPVPECKANQSFDFSEKGSSHSIELNEYLSTKTPDSFRYFFKTFLEEANHTYMLVNFRNETECFDIKMLVDKWDKLAGMRRANGKSYPKELHDLEWKIEGEDIVYINMHAIID